MGIGVGFGVGELVGLRVVGIEVVGSEVGVSCSLRPIDLVTVTELLCSASLCDSSSLRKEILSLPLKS